MNSTFICLPKENFKRAIKVIQNKSESSLVDPVSFSARSLPIEHPDKGRIIESRHYKGIIQYLGRV